MMKRSTAAKTKQVFLRPDSIFNQRLIDALDDLFAAVPPARLKHRIHHVYLWLQASGSDAAELFKELSIDYAALLRFLDLAEECSKEGGHEDPADLSGKAVYNDAVKAQFMKIRQCLDRAAEDTPDKTLGQLYAQITLIQMRAREASELMR